MKHKIPSLYIKMIQRLSSFKAIKYIVTQQRCFVNEKEMKMEINAKNN